MKYKNRVIASGLLLGLFLLIINSRLSARGAADGINLCIKAVIPSLLPFLFLSACISDGCQFSNLPAMEWMGIPRGAESIFLLGLIGGYPVGAQAIYSQQKKGSISRETARRLLGFCNNPGPSFIFGMLSPLFTSSAAPWCLWGIIAVSAVITGLLLPRKKKECISLDCEKSLSLPNALSKSVRAISLICGWVIIFRVFFAFAEEYLLKHLPNTVRVCVIGFMELTNGCVSLQTIPSEPLRFILCAAFLSYGGFCVTMQTASCAKELGLGMYFPGKILQTIISILLAGGVSALIF